MDLDLGMGTYDPLKGSTYVPLPKELGLNKAVLNVQNLDDKCFIWSVLAQIHPVEQNGHRVSHYTEYERDLNMSGITFPVQLKDNGRFELHNQISTNVFGYQEKKVFPLRITEQKEMPNHVNLLLFSNSGKSHYCLIQKT